MNLTRFRTVLLTAAGAIAWCAGAEAQLFSATNAGSQATSAPFPGGAGTTLGNRTSTGAITTNSRFVRTGRQPTDFVGSDTNDRRGFVGSRQAIRRTRTTAAPVPQPRPEPNVNQAQTQNESNSSTSLYPPRLVLDEELTAIQPVGVQAALERRLERSPAIQRTGPIEVSVEDRTATLRGTVASTKDRALAELLVQLEPGISDVRNDLKVKAAAEPIANPRALPSSPPREF